MNIVRTEKDATPANFFPYRAETQDSLLQIKTMVPARLGKTRRQRASREAARVGIFITDCL
jgi:hypothetical protein